MIRRTVILLVAACALGCSSATYVSSPASDTTSPSPPESFRPTTCLESDVSAQLTCITTNFHSRHPLHGEVPEFEESIFSTLQPERSSRYAWSFVFLGDLYRKKDQSGAAKRAYWYAVRLSQEMVGSTPQKEKLKQACFRGLSQVAHKRGMEEWQALLKLSSNVAKSYVASPKAKEKHETFYARMEKLEQKKDQLQEARRRAERQIRAAQSKVTQQATAVGFQAAMAAVQLEASNADAVTVMNKVTEVGKDAMEVGQQAKKVKRKRAKLQRQLEQGKEALGKKAEQVMTASERAQQAVGVNLSLGPQIVQYIWLAEDEEPLLDHLRNYANGRPELNERVTRYAKSATNSPPETRKKLLESIGRKLTEIEVYIATFERRSREPTRGHIEQICGQKSTTLCIMVSKDACERGLKKGCEKLADLALAPNAYHAPRTAKWALERACELRHAQSCLRLATRMRKGKLRGGPIEALVLMYRTCADGHGSACEAGSKYAQQYRHNPDFDRVTEAMSEACLNDKSQACVDLAKSRLESDNSLEEVAKAKAILKSTCSEGSGEACFLFAEHHEEKGNAGQARSFYVDGCEQRHAESCHRAGKSLLEKGTDDDIRDSVSYFRKACNQGHDPGCREFVKAYENGRGRDANRERAGRLYRSWCVGGKKWSCREFARLVAQGIGKKKHHQRAAKVLRRSCSPTRPKSCWRLSQLYLRSDSVSATSGRSLRKMLLDACNDDVAGACADLADAIEDEKVERRMLDPEALRKKACELGRKSSCDR